MKVRCPFMAHTVHHLPDGSQLYCTYDDGDYWVELDDLIKFMISMAGWSHL